MIILMIIGIKVLEIDEVRVNTVLGYSMFKWKTKMFPRLQQPRKTMQAVNGLSPQWKS